MMSLTYAIRVVGGKPYRAGGVVRSPGRPTMASGMSNP